MSGPDQKAEPVAPAVPLGRTFLAAEGPGLDAEIARQAGPGGLRPDDEIIVLTSPTEWTLPNGEIVSWLHGGDPLPVPPWEVDEEGAGK
jgi:hypothetical protein